MMRGALTTERACRHPRHFGTSRPGKNQHWSRKERLPANLGHRSGEPRDPNAEHVNGGISADAGSSYTLGTRFIDLKTAYGVAQIQGLLNNPP